MTDHEAAGYAPEPEQLSDEDVRVILSKPDGSFKLLNFVRDGRIDAERAVTAIEEAEHEPLRKRIFLAILDTFLSQA
jgi:hypothetical protein